MQFCIMYIGNLSVIGAVRSIEQNLKFIFFFIVHVHEDMSTAVCIQIYLCITILDAFIITIPIYYMSISLEIRSHSHVTILEAFIFCKSINEY